MDEKDVQDHNRICDVEEEKKLCKVKNNQPNQELGKVYDILWKIKIN